MPRHYFYLVFGYLRYFGDFYLKYSEFAEGIIKFSQPYITHKPEIRTFELDSHQYYLVAGSNGLWDELNDKEILDMIVST